MKFMDLLSLRMQKSMNFIRLNRGNLYFLNQSFHIWWQIRFNISKILPARTKNTWTWLVNIKLKNTLHTISEFFLTNSTGESVLIHSDILPTTRLVQSKTNK